MQVFTIAETAKTNGLDPQKYIKYLLEQRLNSKMSDEELAEHATWNPEIQKIKSIVKRCQSLASGKMPGLC